ncbi:MAG: hydrogenase maturation protease [Chloroflexi bacterium]|nr:hydrogenase maturation protease [Chloroflexota bacterium]
MSHTLIIGLGNPILTDDGVGVQVARAVEDALPPHLRDEVRVTEAAVGGLRLMEMMAGYRRVILIDAMLGPDPAGTLRRLTLPELETISPTQHSASAHDASLITALEAGRRMGLPLPDDIVIYAIAAENVVDFGEQPTPAVAQAIPRAVEAVINEIVHSS